MVNLYSKSGFLALLSLFCLRAFASGSYDFGGSSEQYERLNQIYDLGKSTLNRKIICSSCPLHQDDLEAENATSLINQLNGIPNSVPNVSEEERQAVIYYLVNRYRLAE